MKKIFVIYYFSIALFILTGCKKLVEIEPPINQLTNDKVFSDYPTATAALIGIYGSLNNSTYVSVYNVLSSSNAADELVDFTSAFTPYFNNSIDVNNGINQGFWQTYYRLIYQANSLLEGIQNIPSLSLAEKNQLTGEGKFLRAFCYFQLVNLYGDIPLLITTDVTFTASAPRSTVAKIYQQMINDLKDAQSILPDTYITGERVRANKSAATALLSRVYLYTGDWVNAESAASTLIVNPQYKLLGNLDSVFFANSQEAILQCWTANGFTLLGQNLIPGASNPSQTFTSDFMDSIESGDLRMVSWMSPINYSGNTYFFPFKYKQSNAGGATTEYLMILRIAEQYLIRAEARAMQNNIAGGLDDVNTIRMRAGLPNILISSQSDLLLAIEKQRRVELFTEWCDRWFDLKRTGRINPVLSLKKPGWQSFDSLYPIPFTELNANPNLTQNPGY